MSSTRRLMVSITYSPNEGLRLCLGGGTLTFEALPGSQSCDKSPNTHYKIYSEKRYLFI